MGTRFPIFVCVSLIAATSPVQAQTTNAQSKSQSLGTVENGVYHHSLTGIEFALPAEWAIVSQARASEPGAQVIKLKNSISNEIATIWLKRRNADSADIQALMSGRLDDKVIQRNNFQGYKYRPESVQHTTVGGRPALSAVADYLTAGQKMVEYLTWIDGESSRALFAGRMPAAELADFQTRFDPIIRSAVVP
ncbi:MAG: hypothetical protein ABSE86_16510 [Bryobacteraceae bacterium]|jgi:hypothetical protein